MFFHSKLFLLKDINEKEFIPKMKDFDIQRTDEDDVNLHNFTCFQVGSTTGTEGQFYHHFTLLQAQIPKESQIKSFLHFQDMLV